MRVISKVGASSVTDPAFGTAEAGPDGVFDLPHDFAMHLTTTAAGQWMTEGDHVALQARQALEELADPRKAQQVIDGTRSRVAELEARVAALEAQLTALTAGEAPSTAPAEPKKPAATKAPAGAAKKTAATKTTAAPPAE